LKARGWRVIATARRQEDLDHLRIQEGLEAIPLELADATSIATCAITALDLTGGRLDAIFNNAAYGQPGAVEDITPSVLREQLEVNLIGTHDLTRRMIPAMRRNGHGRIVQCSSVLGMIAVPYRGAYCASKFALEALADAMRGELAGSGVFVSIIEPGPPRSNIFR
jgi:NAD(P)-dependent dehydrogenase (short-subunit alcohol dehydrogenase family)